MLTIDMLKQNTALAGLSEAQLTAIAEMSKNDENTVIGTKIGALHGQYDTDIFGITGIKKNDGEKSYEYAKRVLNSYKSKIEANKTVKEQLDAANAKIQELQAKLEKGASDEELKKQLKDAKNQAAQLQAQLQAKETEFKTKNDALANEIKQTHVDYAFQAAITGLKFKAGITEPIQKTLLNAAKAEVFAKGIPDFVDDGQGGKKLVLRDTAGNILNNPANNLNPYTIKELVMETSLKDVIDTGQQQKGGGTVPLGSPGNQGSTFDLSGIKTQLEADKAIEAYLLSTGLTRDSREFADQSLQLRNDNNVASLPLR